MNDIEAQIDALDVKIATIAAQQNVAAHALLTAIRAFDACNGWGWQGYKSCAHYLSYRIGLSPGAAREHVRVALALAKLPKVDAELGRGALSYSKVRALTRIADSETEERLLFAAHDLSAGQLEKLVRGWRMIERGASAERREEARAVSYYTDDDGMIVFRARLLAEEGAMVIKALESQKVACVDAFVRMAERSLGHVAEHGAADRTQVILCVDEAVLTGGDGVAEIDGHGVSAETAQRLACDASVVTMAYDKDGKIAHAGKKTRTISAALRRKIYVRDEASCRYPGCANRHVDVHHIEHWAHGGATSLENLLSLCRLCRARHKRHYAACLIMPR